ncbi:MAG: histidine phosphatase family protein [Prevotella sp.]|nr:histidine phosphatase family protein [Prevotella sp.]
MTTLYLVRHGETVDNVNQILQGQGQGELNENGIRQAEALREQLRDHHVDVFVASDLQRSIDTCRIIAAPHGLPVETTALLRERDWGDFTGMFIPDLQGLEWPPNVETLEQMQLRARNFLTYLKTAYRDRVIVAVGHGIINKAIQSVYYKKPMNEIPRMTNAEMRVLML